MDKDTRSAIERATQRSRKLLEEDFASQLEGSFDVLRDGMVASKAGSHLTPREVFQRDKVVAAIEHKQATGMSTAEAVVDYLRDAAFTTLNRFVALKMLEGRELVRPCITKGEQSAGYHEFCAAAPGVALLPASAGYRLYIESLFDELSTEVKVLFDRRDPASVLWPKRATFEALLEILNASELASVWGEDETIGWVYQYFNGGDERKKMRDESQAPRNSRELAVRNQFFTPRYVVEFLVDNTLGRIWYEMRGGQTALVNRCEYLVRRPDETYPPRAKKDPRDVRVLDPACGSGHFLLYAFDLLLAIYEEAHRDTDGPKSEATGNTLAADYASIDALKRALPALVLAHNLHGVDIDPRCAQIAQLALWMRAQRAFRDFGIGRAERPLIRRSNIVVAEPLVTDDGTLREFLAKLGDAELGRVFTGLVETLKLAGDLGLLLRVEALIARGPRRGQTGELFAPPEARIRAALAKFVAGSGARASTRRRLFADDAAQGMGLLETAEKKFDVVLMNPPFGEASLAARTELYASIPDASQDLFAAFVARAAELLCSGGAIGVLTNRLAFFNHQLAGWRERLFYGEETHLTTVADLGYGVLDAVVEVAAFVCERRPVVESVVVSALHSLEKRKELADAVSDARAGKQRTTIHRVPLQEVRRFPASRFAYAVPQVWRTALNASGEHPMFRGRKGVDTGDDFRFFRTFWELAPYPYRPHRRWVCKGGEFSRYQCNTHLVLDWRDEKNFRRTSNSESYGERGITYTYRTTSSLSARPMTDGSCFSTGGPALLPSDKEELHFLLAYANSFVATYCLEATVGGGDFSVKGTAARNLQPTYLQFLPKIPMTAALAKWFEERVALLVSLLETIDDDETSPLFSKVVVAHGRDFDESAVAVARAIWGRLAESYPIVIELETRISELVALTTSATEATYPITGWPLPTGSALQDSTSELLALASPTPRNEPDQGLRDCCKVEHRFASKLSHYVHAEVEAVAHAFSVSPEAVCRVLAQRQVTSARFVRRYAWNMVSALTGIAFGRWSGNVIVRELPAPVSADVFASLPWPQPAAMQSTVTDVVLVDDEGHPSDLPARIAQVLAARLNLDSGVWLEQAVAALGSGASLRKWLRQNFFEEHVRAYTKSRRAAPVYWQLATPTASYSVWVCLHSLTKDTLYKVQNDFVAPKLAHEERRLESMRGELRMSPTAAERRVLALQELFVDELRAFFEEVRRIAPLWNPNLDDGVIINFAPLWRLVPQHQEWQKELKATWDALCAGDYDWAHLAMHLWPERVVPKCATDRSLAIAHGIEDVFWAEGSDGKWKARTTPARSVQKLVGERSSPAVTAARDALLGTPAAPSGGKRARAPARGLKSRQSPANGTKGA